jgi:hypothetical protein
VAQRGGKRCVRVCNNRHVERCKEGSREVVERCGFLRIIRGFVEFSGESL